MNRSTLLIAASCALSAALVVQGAEKKSKAGAKAHPEPTFLPAADMKWEDLDPKGAPGVKIVDLWGNHAKGAYGAILKLPAGFTVPLHTHTHAMKVVFLSGTYLQTPEGKSEVRLGPGSYMLQPGGGYRHVTSCDKASECVFFLESSGPFDLHVVDQGKK